MKVVVSDSLSRGYDKRYVVVDEATGQVLDDAQGYGYKSRQNAHRGYSYKSMPPKKQRQREEIKHQVERWCAAHPDLMQHFEQAMFYAIKDGENITEADVREILAGQGVELPFPVKDLDEALVTSWTSGNGPSRMANRGPDDYLSATAAAHRLGVSTRTLRRYAQEGRLPDARGAGGRRIFRIADLDSITRRPLAGRAVGYAQVSSRRQQAEGDLHRQVARLRAHDDALLVFTDVASGLSDRRAGLRKALGECMRPGVDRLVVEHPDRLARFGVGLIEHLLAGYGVSVDFTGQEPDESAESELVRGMLAIVTSFAGRLYGQRSAKTKRLRAAAVAAETESGDAA